VRGELSPSSVEVGCFRKGKYLMAHRSCWLPTIIALHDSDHSNLLSLGIL
jgi:hypothetical protein